MILFIDYSCYKPYDPYILNNEPLGGTEATVTRVAEALGRNNEVVVVQHNRLKTIKFNATYTTIEDAQYYDPTHVITVRSQRIFPFIYKSYLDAKHFIWVHDLPFETFVMEAQLIKSCKFRYIAVSSWHHAQIVDKTGNYRADHIYNPIDDLKPSNKPVDKNKLVFFSSPHKGLKETIGLFKNLLVKFPDLKLYYSNPGYFPNHEENHPSIINIGQKSNKEILDFISDAFCVFYPNHVYPETFGLIAVEANALGVPVLTHDRGAIGEVLDNPNAQLVDCKNTDKVIEQFSNWYEGSRPIVHGKEACKINNVLKNWEDLLGLTKVEKQETIVTDWNDAITV